MQEIRSTSNERVKHWCRLREQRRYRESEGVCLLAGRHLVEELHSPPRVVLCIEGLAEDVMSRFPVETEFVVVSDAVMKKVTGLENPDGIAAEVYLPQRSLDAWQEAVEAIPSHQRRVLILDAVSDPGNTGTLIRTALALGWSGMFLLEGSCDPCNDKALRAAKGATFRLPIAQGSWQDLSQSLAAGSWQVLRADLAGQSPEEIVVEGPVALVLGNESRGLSEEAAELLASTAVTIPMTDAMESLNVGVAGAILMYALGVKS